MCERENPRAFSRGIKACHPSPTGAPVVICYSILDAPVRRRQRVALQIGTCTIYCVKPKVDLGSDILPAERRECTPMEIRAPVAEMGKIPVNHVTVELKANDFVGSSRIMNVVV